MADKSAAPDSARKRMMPIYAGLPTEFGGGAPAEADEDLFGPGQAGVLGGLTGTANGDPAGRLAGLLKGVSAGTGAYLGGRALMPADGEMDWGTVGGAAGGGAAGYLAAHALLKLLSGGDSYGPGVLGKKAEAVPALPALLLAKEHSDNLRYAQKHAILRDLIRTDPTSFVVDSDDGFAVGLTHGPTGFRIHMPGHMLPAELPRPVPEPVSVKAANKLVNLLYGGGAKLQSAGQATATGTKAVAGTTAKATGNYVKSLAGYGEAGNLKGQKLFDSTTVKPFMTPKQLKTQVAGGANPEALAATHQLPSWYHKIPGVTTATRALNWADRNRFLHPFVQSGRTVNNVLSTPFTRPLMNPVQNSLLTRGAANVARGGGRALLGRAQQAGGYTLKGVDATLGAGTKAMNYGSLGLGAAGVAHSAWQAPSNNAKRMVYSVPTTREARPNPELERLERNPLPAIWDGLTDKSDVAQMQRDIGRRHLPYAVGNAAYNAQQQAETHPFYRTLKGLRRFSIGGNMSNAAIDALADPTEAPTDQIVREEATRAAPKILNNYDANLSSPTGQRMVRLFDPVVRDPAALDGVAITAHNNSVKGGGKPLLFDPNFRQGLETAKAVQPHVDLGDLLASDPVRKAAPMAASLVPEAPPSPPTSPLSVAAGGGVAGAGVIGGSQ